jgi:hypothetical protein
MKTPLLAMTHLEPAAPWFVLLIVAIVLVAIWDGVWKLIAMWKSARNNQLPWFICLAIFNTAGILPILYIVFFQPKPAPPMIASQS